MSRIIVFVVFLLLFFAMDLYVFQGYRLLVRRWATSYGMLLNVLYWAVPVTLLLLIVGTWLFSPDPTKNAIMMWSSSILFGLFIAKFVWVLFMVIDDIVRLVKLGGLLLPQVRC
jgi:hypothetical protein